MPIAPEYDQLTEEEQLLYAEKTAYQRGEDITPEEHYHRAGIWAEFGKIICLSVGYFAPNSPVRNYRIKSFTGNEKDLLVAFKSLLEKYFNLNKHLLCAHNGKEFDFPYIARRMIIHGISLPKILNHHGKKPWEIPHLDTLQLWRFGDYKHYISLKLLAHILGIPSPKDDIDGSQVARVYYEDQQLDRIVSYCEKDVVTIAQILLKMLQEPLLEPDEIIHSKS